MYRSIKKPYHQTTMIYKSTQTNKKQSAPQQQYLSHEQALQKINHRYHSTKQTNYIRQSAATIDIRQRNIQRKKRAITYSHSVDNKESTIYRPTQHITQQNKRDRLYLLREQKIVKLKQLYAIQKEINNQQRSLPKSTHNKIKFNNINSINRINSTHIQNKKQSKAIIFNKHQKINQDNNASSRSLPKFLDYCEKSNQKKINQRQFQFKMPQKIKQQQHFINKVKSMKNVLDQPALIPVTFKIKKNVNLDESYSLQWLIKQYQPHLQSFQKANLKSFIMKKYNKFVYFGQFKTNTQIKQGKGILFYQNGKIFQGNFLNDQKNGQGYQQYPDKSFFLGNFVKGKRQGKGRFQWANGQIYDGQWLNGKKEGSGIWKGAEGVSYVGQWHNDTIDGFGVLVDSVSKYEGQFKNFIKYGNGTLKFLNGQVYTGFFKHNLPNGVGEYFWNNGDHYNGQFTNGKRHGKGIVKYSNGGFYEGYFQNDKKSGKGQESYQQNLYYVGQFQNDFRHGWGRLTCGQQIVYEGYWLNNSAVSSKNRKIDTIIQQQQSIYDKDTSKNSGIKKINSNLSLARSKMEDRKRKKTLVNQNLKQIEEIQQKKIFRRACNCERHRKKFQLNN